MTTDVLKKLRVKVMDWASMSPDPNPVEHLWGILKWKVEERRADPRQGAQGALHPGACRGGGAKVSEFSPPSSSPCLCPSRTSVLSIGVCPSRTDVSLTISCTMSAVSDRLLYYVCSL